MKVLLVNKFHYRKGGSETYYFTLAEALKARGHEVLFFAMQDASYQSMAQVFLNKAKEMFGAEGYVAAIEDWYRKIKETENG